jgi:chemotaxis protein MotA
MKSLGLFLNGPKMDPEGAISTIERLAQLARKDGVLALEKEIDKLDDHLMKKGIEMVSMNTDAIVIENTLFSEIDMMFVSNNSQNEYYEKKWKVKKAVKTTAWT